MYMKLSFNHTETDTKERDMEEDKMERTMKLDILLWNLAGTPAVKERHATLTSPKKQKYS